MQKIAIGNDHGGLLLKQYLIKNLPYHWVDIGAYNAESSDYPDFSQKVAQEILTHQAKFGILICRSGIGVSIAANRFKGIYAALCLNEAMAQSARTHNNANILCLAADYIQHDTAVKMVRVFLKTPFEEGGRHERRVQKIDTGC